MNGKIFFDTNPIIYFLSQHEKYAQKVSSILENAILDRAELYTSTITDAEYLAFPYKISAFSEIERYKDFLDDYDFVKCVINEKVAETSAALRAKYTGIKLPDALQLAAAIDNGCSSFVTNDKQLKRVSEVIVILLDD